MMHFSFNFLAIFAFILLLIGVTVSMPSDNKTENKGKEVEKSENEGEKFESQAEMEVEQWSPGISISGGRMSRLLQVDNLYQQNSDIKDEQLEEWNPEEQRNDSMTGLVYSYFQKKSAIPGNEDYFGKWNTDGMEAISITSRERILKRINPHLFSKDEQSLGADRGIETNEQEDVGGSGKHEIGGGPSTKQMHNKPDYIPSPLSGGRDPPSCGGGHKDHRSWTPRQGPRDPPSYGGGRTD